MSIEFRNLVILENQTVNNLEYKIINEMHADLAGTLGCTENKLIAYNTCYAQCF